MAKFILCALLFMLLSACQSFQNMDIRYKSLIDPEYKFTSNTVISVVSNDESLESKFYIRNVIDALKARGFSHVYTYKEVKEIKPIVDVVAIMEVRKVTDSYEYQGADWGMVDTGTTNTSCTGYGYSVNCTQTQGQTLGITGYSTKTAYLTGYYFLLNWLDMSDKSEVLRMKASSFVENCSDRAVYEFLIYESIKSIDLDRPSDRAYEVTMPPEYRCDY